jgi:hypothetical protein
MSRQLRQACGAPVALIVAIACGAVAVSADARAETPGAHEASPQTRRQRDLKAYEAFLARRVQESLELTAALYEDFPDPIYLRNLGRCHQLLEHPDAAIYYFGEYLSKAQGLDPAQRAEVQGFIRQMEQLKRDQVAAGLPRKASSPHPLAPAQPKTPTRRFDDPWADEEPRPVPTPKAIAVSPPRGDPDDSHGGGLARGGALGLAAGLGAVGAAAVVVGSVFGLQAKDRSEQSNAGCSPMNVCSPEGKALRDEALRKADVSTIAFVTSGVFLGASLYFLLSAPPAPPAKSKLTRRGARLDPRVSDHGALLLVAGEF